MSEIGKYIYGIINSNRKISFGPCGATECKEVYTIPYQDISAVVRDSKTVDYTHLPKDATARYLVSHQQVIEKIMENFYC